MSSRNRSRYRKRQSRCKRKHRYDSEDEAVLVLAHYSDTSGLMPYRCRYCAGWHLGHNDAWIYEQKKLRHQERMNGQNYSQN